MSCVIAVCGGTQLKSSTSQRQEAKVGRLLRRQSCPGLHSEFQASPYYLGEQQDPVLKKEMEFI